MPPHTMSTRQGPGWWPNLVQAVCSCGWRGPVRNLNGARSRVLIRIDKNAHAGEAGGGE